MIEEQLKEIHKKIFNKFEYMTDMEQYGEPEKWVMPWESEQNGKLIGDCEDFALACRIECRHKDLLSRLIYCIDETGNGHCVLECEGWILDNRYKTLQTQSSLPDYEWKRISGYWPGDPWYEIV